jgi:hypothetical protein
MDDLLPDTSKDSVELRGQGSDPASHFPDQAFS